jgi:hypothetical protein
MIPAALIEDIDSCVIMSAMVREGVTYPQTTIEHMLEGGLTALCIDNP